MRRGRRYIARHEGEAVVVCASRAYIRLPAHTAPCAQ